MQGFRTVAGFIFGGNTLRESVAMTSPVRCEPIAMTSPVRTESAGAAGFKGAPPPAAVISDRTGSSLPVGSGGSSLLKCIRIVPPDSSTPAAGIRSAAPSGRLPAAPFPLRACPSHPSVHPLA